MDSIKMFSILAFVIFLIGCVNQPENVGISEENQIATVNIGPPNATNPSGTLNLQKNAKIDVSAKNIYSDEPKTFAFFNWTIAPYSSCPILNGNRTDQKIKVEVKGNCNILANFKLVAFCGNGTIEPGEECDGSSLKGKNCQSFGYAGGKLSCKKCKFDKSGCETE